MRKYSIPQPQRVRRIEKSFAWIDHRLLRNGYLAVMSPHDQGLYLFLVLAADRHGVSFYRKEKIGDAVGLTFVEFEVARDRLIDLGLIAFEPYSALTPNGYHQVLPVEGDLQPEPYAYRVERSALDAVSHVRKLLHSRYTQVVDADLSGYLETSPYYTPSYSAVADCTVFVCCFYLPRAGAFDGF